MQHSMAAVVRDDFSTPFFEAAARGQLLLRFSPSSGEWSEPQARVCSVTQKDDLEWRPARGEGILVSWTVKPRRPVDGVSPPPVVIGIVETVEGPWLPLQLPEVDLDRLAVGAVVRVAWVQPEGSEHLPVAVLA